MDKISIVISHLSLFTKGINSWKVTYTLIAVLFIEHVHGVALSNIYTYTIIIRKSSFSLQYFLFVISSEYDKYFHIPMESNQLVPSKCLN